MGEHKHKVTAIAVVAANGVIGDGKDQPFKFREDWARFKRITMGHPLVLGRRTHEAMGMLPGRTSIVISHMPQNVVWPEAKPSQSRGTAVDSVEKALNLAVGIEARSGDETFFVIGGGEIYRACWDFLTDLDITQVHDDADGEVTFPSIDAAEWEEVSREPHEQFDFVHYVRRGPAKALQPFNLDEIEDAL